ncbi:MAG: hypothetical protein RBU30_21640 [Polyangia bacterium]|jgi:hypothetical protein|nr:hypothetical protein [Polyangia bacterium]
MSLGGIGGVLDAGSRARYMARQMAAIRAPHIRLRPGEMASPSASANEWEPHECFQLCVECGYLAEGREQPCPGCGSKGWVDLRRISEANQIREMERGNRQVIPRSLSRIGYLVGVALGLGALALTYSIALPLLENNTSGALVMAMAVGIVTAILGSWLLPRLLVFLLYKRRPTFPLRWRLPVPLPSSGDEPAALHEGQAVATNAGELLRAPITGEPCLAYEVSVLFDTPGDLRPPMWILEEERSVAFALDGQEVPPDRVTLELPVEPVGDESPEGSRAVALFLRKRGLFASEGDYTLFEALVRPGLTYRLELFDCKAARISQAG